jgi:hypothetical protein
MKISLNNKPQPTRAMLDKVYSQLRRYGSQSPKKKQEVFRIENGEGGYLYVIADEDCFPPDKTPPRAS